MLKDWNTALSLRSVCCTLSWTTLCKSKVKVYAEGLEYSAESEVSLMHT